MQFQMTGEVREWAEQLFCPGLQSCPSHRSCRNFLLLKVSIVSISLLLQSVRSNFPMFLSWVPCCRPFKFIGHFFNKFGFVAITSSVAKQGKNSVLRFRVFHAPGAPLTLKMWFLENIVYPSVRVWSLRSFAAPEPPFDRLW